MATWVKGQKDENGYLRMSTNKVKVINGVKAIPMSKDHTYYSDYSILKRKLNRARQQERIERRKLTIQFQKEQRRIATKTDRTPIIFKYLMVIIFVMTFLTFALNGNLQLDNISKVEGANQPQLDGIEYHEVQYDPNYENQFNDYEVTHLNRLLAGAQAIEQFGTNMSWKRTLNNIRSGEINGVANTIITIGQVIITPINLIIQIVGLGINEINALTGREQIAIPSLLFFNDEIGPQNAYGRKFMHWWAEFVDWLS